MSVEVEGGWAVCRGLGSPGFRVHAYCLRPAACRLAVLDLDWESVRAVDILAALRSFLPTRGHIRSVTVYPSDYGLERMAEEARAGPQVMGFWRAGGGGLGEGCWCLWGFGGQVVGV